MAYKVQNGLKLKNFLKVSGVGFMAPSSALKLSDDVINECCVGVSIETVLKVVIFLNFIP